MADLIIRNARVIDASSDDVRDVSVEDGKIAEVGHNLNGSAVQEIDASGLVLFPGLIDPHVHFNEPGRTEWEGFETGTAALAKGGVTSFFDMPLNSSPPTTTVEAYDLKRRLADEKSKVNAYLWGGLVPGNLDQLEGLVKRGVIGFKAFMSNSGIEDFQASDDKTLRKGMLRIAELGSILAVHAEDDELTMQLAQQAIAEGRTGVRDYLASRPAQAELNAIKRVIALAEETGCRLHVVHVSTAEGIMHIMQAAQQGVDLSCETCPHYLVLTQDDVERIGAASKCAPPIRSAQARDDLWTLLLAQWTVTEGDALMVIGSDHSPSPVSMKQSDNFFAIWGGIASCQSTLSLMLTAGYHQRGMELSQIAALTSYNTTQRFGLTSKGRIAEGADADLVLVDIDASYRLKADDLEYRHRISPYIGMELRGQVQKTWVGGKQVYG
jgi:allantoinase